MLGYAALIRFVLREDFMFLILLLFDRSYCSAFCNFIHLILFLEFHGCGLNTNAMLSIFSGYSQYQNLRYKMHSNVC